MSTIIFQNKKYTLTTNADFTNRLLPAPYANYHEAEDGENFDFEMTALATDDTGSGYNIFWIFTDTKGNQKELDCFRYDNINRIEKL